VAAPGILPDAWYPVAVWMGSGDPVDGLAARAGRIVTGSEGFPAPPPGEPVSAPAALDAGRFAPGQVPVPETATALEAYGRCPLQYAWRALGVEPLPDAGTEPSPALVGQWAHAALHRVAGQPLAGRDAARAVADAVAAAVAALPPPRTVLPEAVAAAVSVLVSDLAWLVLRWPAAGRVYGEEPFRLQVDGAFVRGRIDRLEETAAGGVRALDYKSGGQVPPPSVAPSRLQLPLYARAAQERFGVGDDQVEAGYWGIRRAGGYPRRMLPPPFAERWREAVAIVAGIRERAGAGWFLPYPESPRTCEVCDYRIACPVSAPRDKADLGRRHPAFAALWDGVDGAENGDSP
jgi:RecB family exonuclease